MKHNQLYHKLRDQDQLPEIELQLMVEQKSIEELRQYRDRLLGLIAITNTVIDHKEDERSRPNVRRTGW